MDLLGREAGRVGGARGSRRGRGGPCSGSVWAKTSATLAWLPSEIHILAPLSTQPSVGPARARALVGRVGARVGLGQPEAAEPLARAQLRQVAPASAPRCPSARSRSTRARSARTRPCAWPSSRGRSPRRRSRRSGSRARRRRSRAGRSRRGSPGRRSWRRARVSKWWLRSLSRARGTISRSVNVARRLADQLLLVGEREVHGRTLASHPWQRRRSRGLRTAHFVLRRSRATAGDDGARPDRRLRLPRPGARPRPPRGRARRARDDARPGERGRASRRRESSRTSAIRTASRR